MKDSRAKISEEARATLLLHHNNSLRACDAAVSPSGGG
jgi:hypothetical protein